MGQPGRRKSSSRKSKTAKGSDSDVGTSDHELEEKNLDVVIEGSSAEAGGADSADSAVDMGDVGELAGGGMFTKWIMTKDHLKVDRQDGLIQSIMIAIVTGILAGFIAYFAYDPEDVKREDFESDEAFNDKKDETKIPVAVAVGGGLALIVGAICTIALVKKVTDVMQTRLIMDIAKSSACMKTCCWSCSCKKKGVVEIYSMDPTTPVVYLRCADVDDTFEQLKSWTDRLISDNEAALAKNAQDTNFDGDGIKTASEKEILDTDTGMCCASCGCRGHVTVTSKSIELTSMGCCSRRSDIVRMNRVFDLQLSQNCFQMCCCKNKATVSIYSFDRDGYISQFKAAGAIECFEEMKEHVHMQHAVEVFFQQQKAMGIVGGQMARM